MFNRESIAKSDAVPCIGELIYSFWIWFNSSSVKTKCLSLPKMVTQGSPCVAIRRLVSRYSFTLGIGANHLLMMSLASLIDFLNLVAILAGPRPYAIPKLIVLARFLFSLSV